jgi:hypothetical protein
MVCILQLESKWSTGLPKSFRFADLFEYMRKLAVSHDLRERFETLWVGEKLGERLARCSDHQIGTLLCAVQDGLGIFTAEFVVCEHAKRRLLKSSEVIPERN